MKSTTFILSVLLSLPILVFCQKEQPHDMFIPAGYKISQTVYGDLNKDGLDDCVLIIKGTDKAGFGENQFGDIVDKNRRGIIILFKTETSYELALQNKNCFSSENEDGGVYYAPIMNVSLDRGNLFINYEHGRYGYWNFTFRLQNNDFNLIGYDAAEHFGPTINGETSINFSTKRKLVRENVNDNTEESGDEVFKETWSDIQIEKLIKLSEIDDFDTLTELRFNF